MANETNNHGEPDSTHSHNRIQYIEANIRMPYKTGESEITQKPGKYVLKRVTITSFKQGR